MRKKLIVALIVVGILLAAAVGVLLWLERGGFQNQPDVSETTTAPGAEGEETSGQTPAETTVTPETTEETVGISLPTEAEEEKAPEYTFGQDDPESTETAPSVDPDATFDPDENETPEMPL